MNIRYPIYEGVYRILTVKLGKYSLAELRVQRIQRGWFLADS